MSNLTNKELRKGFDNTIANMFSHINFSRTYLFYANLIGQCSVKMNTSINSPAGVLFRDDHYELFINPNEFDILPLEQRLGILKHEMLHILNGHVNRQKERVHKPWNYATDCAINQLIERSHLPDYGIFPDTLIPGAKVPENKSSEQYYDLIKNEMENQDNKCQKCNGTGEEQDADGKSHQCSECNGSGEEPGTPEGSGRGKLLDDHSLWGQSEGSEELQKDITKNMIEKSISETQKSQGIIPNGISGFLEIHSRKSELNWKKVLRGIVGNKKVGKRSTIMRSDRRFPQRTDLRGKTKDRMFNLLVVSDVSGSVSDTALLALWGEVQHICDITKTAVDLIQVDSNPFPPEKLEKKTKLIERKAQGGTVLSPALETAKKHKLDFQAIVVTTDGYISDSDAQRFLDTGKKVIWLIEKEGKILDIMNTGLSKAFQLKE